MMSTGIVFPVLGLVGEDLLTFWALYGHRSTFPEWQRTAGGGIGVGTIQFAGEAIRYQPRSIGNAIRSIYILPILIRVVGWAWIAFPPVTPQKKEKKTLTT